ncbi:MAG: hypothetical protein ACRDQU_18455 [Pseudonocardiaceae bacterium]
MIVALSGPAGTTRQRPAADSPPTKTTRMRESGEAERARRAMARCMAEKHEVADGDG